MPAPRIVKQLVRRFEDNLEAYRSGHYNETQVRLEYIDPFFKALGWDIHNEQGNAEAYKDVVHEAAVKVGGHNKLKVHLLLIITPLFAIVLKPKV